MTGLNLTQVKELIVIPALYGMGIKYSSPAAVNLVLGTGNKESGYIYLTQLDGGPARGFWEMEKATHDDIYATFLNLPAQAELLRYVQSLLVPVFDPFAQMVWNLLYAAVMCRIKYWRSPRSLPIFTDAVGQATMWKTVYNSDLGAGVVDSATISCFTAAIAA